MFQTVYAEDFRNAFRLMDRGDNFSYKGLTALFEYLEQIEEDTGDQIELNVIEICCEFSEYGSSKEALEYYCDISEKEIEDMSEEEAFDRLCESKTVIEFEGGVIILQ